MHGADHGRVGRDSDANLRGNSRRASARSCSSPAAKQRLEELRDELTSKHPALKVHIHSIDLSKHKSVSQLCAWLAEESIAVDFLINNAGVGDRGTFSTSDFGRVNDMVQVNVVSLTLLTRKLLPAMIAAKRGAILNVSSSASFLPIPGMAVYAATKAYVTSFSEALRSEVRGSGITVSALCPGPGAHRVRRGREPAE